MAVTSGYASWPTVFVSLVGFVQTRSGGVVGAEASGMRGRTLREESEKFTVSSVGVLEKQPEGGSSLGRRHKS